MLESILIILDYIKVHAIAISLLIALQAIWAYLFIRVFEKIKEKAND